jgi:hypothetical protein
MSDITLHDGKSKSSWALTLDGGFERGCQISSMTGDGSNNIVLSAQEKVLGRFDELINWKGGRGVENYRDNPEGYFDGSAWTLTSNHILPALQWRIAPGYRVMCKDLPEGTGLTWKALVSPRLYIDVKFTTTASTVADKCWIWLRKVGNPGTLTLEIYADTTGNPSGAVIKSATLAASAVTDVLSIFHDFDWASTTTLATTTAFHIVIYGATTDTNVNHWEIGGDASGTDGQYSAAGSSWTDDTWSMYYLVTDADIARRWLFTKSLTSLASSSFFMTSIRDTGNSDFYKWTEATDLWTEVATTGLGVVTDRPIAVNSQIFFPQGATTVRKWNGTIFDDDVTTDCTRFTVGYDAAAGPQIWRSQGHYISRSDAPDWSTDPALDFGTDIEIGEGNSAVKNMKFYQGQLWVFKGDSVWNVVDDMATQMEYGISDAPDTTNGQAVGVWQQFLFWNWLFSIERMYGGTVDDIGMGWREGALPYGREGTTSAFTSYVGWLFAATDAGTTGTSSVFAYDGLAWHEVFRAWNTGLRIRDIAIQPVSDSRTRLWISVGDFLVYIELPFQKANPLYDTALNYMHESYLITSSIDAGASSRLPKYIKDFTGMVQNLATGIDVMVDYQIDANIGSNNWVLADGFFLSPESVVNINVGNIRKIRFRVRLETATCTKPPDIQGMAPNGYARTPFRQVFTLRIKAGDSYNPDGSKGVDANKLMRWLIDVARDAGRVRMSSSHPLLDNYFVIIPPPSILPRTAPSLGNAEKDVATIVLIEA